MRTSRLLVNLFSAIQYAWSPTAAFPCLSFQNIKDESLPEGIPPPPFFGSDILEAVWKMNKTHFHWEWVSSENHRCGVFTLTCFTASRQHKDKKMGLSWINQVGTDLIRSTLKFDTVSLKVQPYFSVPSVQNFCKKIIIIISYSDTHYIYFHVPMFFGGSVNADYWAVMLIGNSFFFSVIRDLFLTP